MVSSSHVSLIDTGIGRDLGNIKVNKLMSHREYLRLRSNIFPQCDYKENEMNEVDII